MAISFETNSFNNGLNKKFLYRETAPGHVKQVAVFKGYIIRIKLSRKGHSRWWLLYI